MDSNKLFVVAFDFGSTYSGNAFSTCSNPHSIYTCEWQNNNLLSCKAPTSILINKDNEFVAFGFEAHNKYTESLMKDDEDSPYCLTNDEYRYFHQFKMRLHNQVI